jgi:hypothetical protein
MLSRVRLRATPLSHSWLPIIAAVGLSRPQFQHTSNDGGFCSSQPKQTHGLASDLLFSVEIVSMTIRRAFS